MSNEFFTFDLEEQFPRLAQPPIVEAVIHWQARTQVQFDLDSLQTALANEFPGFSSRKPLHRFEMMAQVSTKNPDENYTKSTKYWDGLRLKSDDGKHVIQFTRNGLVFSRTSEYDNWDSFSAAAKQAWGIYLRIAQPLEIERLGVRFINQIASVTPENIAKHLREPPTFAPNLQLKEFVYQSTFALPRSSFEVRVIKVMQPLPQLQASSGLFLDIDVYTNSAMLSDGAEMDETLRRMRWLKNKVFFNLITSEALRLFRRLQ